MKRIAAGLLVASLGVFCVSAAEAAQASQAVNVTASVNGDLGFTLKLFRNEITGADITAGGKMDFGQLVDNGSGTLRSSATSTTATGAVLAYMTVNSHGLPWTLKQTGTEMSSATHTLPKGSLVVVPVYIPGDNAQTASDGSLGSAGTWVSTDKVLYSSPGSMKTIRAYYSISDDPAAGATTPAIPLDMAAGDYSGTITFTVTA